jgi:hypothetical protein
VIRCHGFDVSCVVADRAVLKITEEEFTRPPMDVSMLRTGESFSPFFPHTL